MVKLHVMPANDPDEVSDTELIEAVRVAMRDMVLDKKNALIVIISAMPRLLELAKKGIESDG